MARFKVLFSTHSEDGVTHNAGDIFESERDLLTTFPNKFEQITEVPRSSKKAVVVPDEDEDDIDAEDDEEAGKDGEEEADAGEEPTPKKKKSTPKKK